MFNYSPKIISLVWAVPLLLCLSVTESKAAINKTIIENTSSRPIASSCSQMQPLSPINFIPRNNEVFTSAVARENRTKITKISSDKFAQELELLMAARPDQQTKKCRVLGDC